MSIVKDLLPIIIFLAVFIKCILLNIEIQKQKKYFIETLSHDLRVSTIAQIRGIEILRKNNSESIEQELLTQINDSCNFTLEMINMLLNTYKYENNENILNYEYCKFNEILNNILLLTNDITKEKNIKIYNSSKENIFFQADKESITKAISILILTAINYSDRNSGILIKPCMFSSKFVLNIQYKGLALSEEERKRMFFKNPKFSIVGHGIRMHLCKKIIDFHKGKINITRNNNINSFIFSIPNKKKFFPSKGLCIRFLPKRIKNKYKCFVNNFNISSLKG